MKVETNNCLLGFLNMSIQFQEVGIIQIEIITIPKRNFCLFMRLRDVFSCDLALFYLTLYFIFTSETLSKIIIHYLGE